MEEKGKLIKNLSRRLKQGISAPDFFELVRRLDQLKSEHPSVGSSATAAEDMIRFGQVPYLHFPETSVADLSETDSGRVRILVYFMGLLGVNGPMPLEFTNYVFQRSHNHYDQTLQRFLDIINHRMISLFYRAWSQNEQTVNFDWRKQDRDLVSAVMLALGGSSPDSEKLRRDAGSPLSPYTTANYARYFGMSVKNRPMLEDLLRDYFKLPLRIHDLEPGIFDIPQEFRCVLGKQDTALLGVNAQLGSRYVSVTKKFIVEIGVLDFDHCRELLPGAQGFDRMTELINRYLDRPLIYGFRFLLRGETIPRALLNGTTQLGRSCWLGRQQHRTEQLTLSIGASRIVEQQHKQSYNNRKGTLS